MPSSISSSDQAVADGVGVAWRGAGGSAPDMLVTMPLPTHETPLHQPPVRALPTQPLGTAALVALLVFVAGLLAWEAYWRDWGVLPSYRNSDGEWAEQRRRINRGEGDATVLVGSSRVLFNVQLPVWERISGERPIQLAVEGTSPVPVLEDLAADRDFTGRLLVGVAPDVFFSGFAYRGGIVEYARNEGPAQRSGSWLSKHLLEPYWAFYDPDFALFTVLQRQPWPARDAVAGGIRVRKLAVHDADRNTMMWHKVEHDADYQALARRIWAQDFAQPLPGMETPESKQATIDGQIAKAAAAIATLRGRGVGVLFLRAPSDGEYYAFEQRELPRAISWDLLLERTGSPGIHFEDYPELQGYELPEWSHLSASEASRFTAALVPLIEREFWGDGARPPQGPRR
jgi:hypothetical protein